MSSEELGAVVFLVGYLGLFGLAIRVFGVRRVLWAVFLVVFLAVAVAFKSLGVITGGRRY